MDIDRLVGAAEREREAAEKKTLTGLASKEEKGKVLEKIDRQIGKLEAAKRADRKDDERKEIDRAQRELQKTRHAVESETTFAAQNLNPSLDKKQRKIISEIIGILYHVLDEGPFGKARDAILAKYQIPDKEDER